MQATRRLISTARRTYTTRSNAPSHLLTLDDLSPSQITSLVHSAKKFKNASKNGDVGSLPLQGKTLAIMFNKRSTRTRVATESAMAHLGGHAMFLGSQDIQLGVNESLKDTSIVVSSMVDGMMCRVGDHSEVEQLAQDSTVPVINALSNLFHPTQILADLLTLHETYATESSTTSLSLPSDLHVSWVGDANNILFELIAALPRLGIRLSYATPSDIEKYPFPNRIQEIIKRQPPNMLTATHDPYKAVNKANVIVTDTWISMGQEQEKEQRLKDFKGYQVTEELAKKGGAHDDWKFMHCLPRKPQEVDDQVFYGPRSLVFPEAENRKWTILAVIDALLVKGRVQ